MKITEEKIKQLIKEEIVKITEQEDMDAKIEKAKNEMKQEAAKILSQTIDATAKNMNLSSDMLKGFLIQYLNEN